MLEVLTWPNLKSAFDNFTSFCIFFLAQIQVVFYQIVSNNYLPTR